MFYVGDILWMETNQEVIPANFIGGAFWPDKVKVWFNKGKIQSFQNPVTKEWMPARINYKGSKQWYDKGIRISDPETYFKDRGGIQK